MSILDRFVGFLKGKNKDKENDINNPEKENKIKDFINSINQPQPLIENLQEKIIGLYPIDNAFVIMERIIEEKSSEDKTYALKKAKSILDENREGLDYYSKTGNIYVIYNDINLYKEKVISSFLNYVKTNSNEDNAIYHLRLIGAIFKWAKNEQVKNNIKEAIEAALLKIICNVKILKECEKHYDFLFELSPSYNKEDYLSKYIIRNKAVYAFPREEKVDYIDKEIKERIESKSKFLWCQFPILKENVPLYKDYISFFFDNIEEKDSEGVYPLIQCEHKEIAELMLSERFAEKVSLYNIFENIKKNFINTGFIPPEELISTAKETTAYLNSCISDEQRNKLSALLNLSKKESCELSKEPSSKMLIGYIEAISAFAKEKPFNNEFLRLFKNKLLPLMQKEELTELKNIVDNVMNNAEINDALKNEFIKNIYVQKRGYFNMSPDYLKNALECYSFCSNYSAFNKVGFFENMFNIDLLRNGYRIYEHEKTEMILDLLKTQEINIQKQIIFGMIKYNNMYKDNETEHLSIIESYNQLKNTLKTFIKENSAPFKTSEIILSDSFNSDNLTINNILDLQEFEFGMDTNGNLEQLKEREEYLNLFEKSPIEAYSYARVFVEKEMLSPLITEDSIDEEIIPKRRRI